MVIFDGVLKMRSVKSVSKNKIFKLKRVPWMLCYRPESEKTDR